MIYLQEDTVNQVIVTLQEKTTLDTPFYLFVFKNDTTNEEKIFTASDISTNIIRYNEFDIEVTTGPENLLTGVVNMDPSGYWKYTIYEQVSPTNLDVDNTVGIVETGKVYLQGDVKPEKIYYNESTDKKYAFE